MVHHIVLWNFVSELSEAEKAEAGVKIKSLLEPIQAMVAGAVDLKVVINEASSSNKDIALLSTFDSFESLQEYQMHPAHVEAGKYIRSVTCDRACLDYQE